VKIKKTGFAPYIMKTWGIK